MNGTDSPDQTTRFEKIPVDIFNDSAEASKMVAFEIASFVKLKQAQGKNFVLGLATGSTPTSVYDELIRLHKQEGLSFKNVITFNLDEYYPMQPNSLQSYVRFMKENLFDHIDIDPANIHIPDGTLPVEKVSEFCHEYERKIETVGGIDLQVLGIGRTGHIGFNEPGSSVNSLTRLITLDHITRTDAASDFFGDENVPRRAITMGIGTIRKAKKIILMAWGEGKANIIKATVEGNVSEMVPATYLQLHTDAKIVLDNASSSELTRVKTPWLVGTCKWNDDLIRRAVVWLCQKLNKPVLKLMDRDYTEHGMDELITEQGPAQLINIKVFNDLQHTISGWPGGKPNADDTYRPERANPFPKRVIIFSPHPDDDVISMGGTFLRLVEQGHEVHLAYQTSGNIAVFDDDAIRFVDFVRDFNEIFHLQNKDTDVIFGQVNGFLKVKAAGQADLPNLQKIKAVIRRGEAKAACRFFGVEDENIHFLDMPFYETGLVKKKPLSDKDIQIIADLIEEIKPHQIYAAGDLSDPHGTHRVCLTAIYRAIDQLKKEQWMRDCYVWLYRGAWQEWDLDQIEMAVPISPDELLKKRKAIFKHQSQKDRPLFPGPDHREFWQRAEERNRTTAKMYDALGLAEYEAIEAFRRYHF
ncbi:MAG TPA: glucosamine-6-phosphate deaminase [Chitinophagales bacterium]|nr:glucosamine-6-phosphate deaminase [Chitinophagales bacterium]